MTHFTASHQLLELRRRHSHRRRSHWFSLVRVGSTFTLFANCLMRFDTSSPTEEATRGITNCHARRHVCLLVTSNLSPTNTLSSGLTFKLTLQLSQRDVTSQRSAVISFTAEYFSRVFLYVTLIPDLCDCGHS